MRLALQASGAHMRSDHVLSRVGSKAADDRAFVDDALKGLGERPARSSIPSNTFDFLALAFLTALAVLVCFTAKDYAISNDEGVQHHYGELIIAYYRSGLRVRDLFSFDNLYLYGGLFDVTAIALGQVIPIDIYELRHILCAATGIAGIALSGAAARLIAGPRAGFIATIALALCGAWYGAMFNHTKDIPFAAAMSGATLVLLRLARQLPAPRAVDLVVFGCLAGAALGLRSYGLLVFVYLGIAILIYLPWTESCGARLTFVANSVLKTCPAMAGAYLLMILAWPWAALSPLNPIRGLFAFSEFQYAIRTLFAGHVYEMAKVPRAYVPFYLFIRVPLITQAGAALGMTSLLWLPLKKGSHRWRELALLSTMILLPLGCQALVHGPAFSGMRHFLFVLPPLAVLAGVGLSDFLDAIAVRSRRLAWAALAAMCASFLSEGVLLARLHPYENLSYNAMVGGLPGAFRRYDLDYWFNSMPEAIRMLETFVRETTPPGDIKSPTIYSVAVCGERPAFDHTVTLPQLRWDFRSEWDESEFFIAPTHMNCDRDLDGAIIGRVERMGVPIAYVKDRRAIVKHPTTDVSSPLTRQIPAANEIAREFRQLSSSGQAF
ncbi:MULTISPECIES: ArnT family glycosyltransferase [Bradyrhizobium]|uniref:ArnT family glycosyltransferase n=1 Tax=Bradyrhizobium TaxID=374 RepID=UPI001EDC2A03|nr:glycosyltransferase family 39 protein [Bradyrhizobium zhengyangense]MCG2644031.1 glycosyltransferase family 39 protein [Bradyrhizobium zhengyangense]